MPQHQRPSRWIPNAQAVLLQMLSLQATSVIQSSQQSSAVSHLASGAPRMATCAPGAHGTAAQGPPVTAGVASGQAAPLEDSDMSTSDSSDVSSGDEGAEATLQEASRGETPENILLKASTKQQPAGVEFETPSAEGVQHLAGMLPRSFAIVCAVSSARVNGFHAACAFFST